MLEMILHGVSRNNYFAVDINDIRNNVSLSLITYTGGFFLLLRRGASVCRFLGQRSLYKSGYSYFKL